jgi:hypothetical protein
MDDFERQRILDEEHLRLLRIGYFVAGGTTAFVCMFGLFYVFMGFFFTSSMMRMPSPPGGPPPPPMGWIFVVMGMAIMIFGAVMATFKFLTARALGRRNAYTLCLITAGLSCLSIPYGTFLGICTFMVLARPSVRALFEAGRATPPPVPPVA